ncbi:MAG: ATP-binding protein [Patescibacteria group bacterium]|nr:ATP-binding protein [Patescibacteria group bacterium]
MQRYLLRKKESIVQQDLKNFPAVAILGPRQCGKSTMALKLGEKIKNFLYLDLELPSDAMKLNDPELFFNSNKDRVICLDEIQTKPEIFSTLRGIIDKNRKNGRFILLGSASPEIIQKSSETLAGRISFIELTPFTISEVKNTKLFNLNNFWLTGGYPESFLAKNNDSSFRWRENFTKTFIERDIPKLGISISSVKLRRFIKMCSHFHGQLINTQKIGDSFGISYHTVKNYIDIFEKGYIFRSLQPFETNLKKRLIKSPKLYIRDSGIFHTLLEINNFNDLLGHPSLGSSWEGFMIENILSELYDWSGYFYRTSSGNEIDLILTKGKKKIAIEFKSSTAPTISRGFYIAAQDLKIDYSFIISPIKEMYQLKKNIYIANLESFLEYVNRKA